MIRQMTFPNLFIDLNRLLVFEQFNAHSVISQIIFSAVHSVLPFFLSRGDSFH